jgi:hypothetical protein
VTRLLRILVAAAAAAVGAAAADLPLPQFVDITRSAGIAFHHVNGASADKHLVEGGSTCSW